jgi:hypothetical protein
MMAAYKLKKIPLETLKAKNSNTIPVVVTLTSIPSRLKTIHITIRSLLNQSVKPEKIILWLDEDIRNQVPNSLEKLIGENFEIKTGELSPSPHSKLVYSLAMFPEKTLVSCDDDLIYPTNWLTSLYNDHLLYPESIIAHKCRTISYDDNGVLLPYKQWPMESTASISNKKLLALGFGGVLYPMGSLHEDATNQDLFMQLTPKADDLWFKMMSYLKSTEVRRPTQSSPEPCPIIGSQEVSLKKTNVREDGNRTQWLALCEHYSVQL